MENTSHETPQETPEFQRNPGRFNRNGQHWVYLFISSVFFILAFMLVINFFLTGYLNPLLLSVNLVGLFATMFCHTRYFRRSGERAPWHYWKLFIALRK